MYESVAVKTKGKDISNDKKFEASDKANVSMELDLDNSTGLVEPCLGVTEVCITHISPDLN